MSQYQKVRGTKDLLPQDNIIYRFVEESCYTTAHSFGYGEIDTPIFEFSDVFHRTLGESSDVVHKETYTFLDRGGDSITLRPEGTAGAARCFINEGLAQNIPVKFYYQGPMFRYERPQKGRYRQFHQVGAEYIGTDLPEADVETIIMAQTFLKKIGIYENVTLEINTLGDLESRARYREALVNYFTEFKEQLSPDSQMRLEKNPLRILDSKNETDKKINLGAPQFVDFLNETSKLFFDRVLKGLDKLNISYKLNPLLVRGLDYYNHTVFEFVTAQLGSQGTVLAGGRYDGLIEQMGGPKVAGVGWAAGIERLCDLIPTEKIPKSTNKIAIIPADSQGEASALQIAQALRENHLVTDIFWKGNVGKKMQKANKWNAQHAIIIGEKEITEQLLTVKNLLTGEQQMVAQAQLINFLLNDKAIL